MASPPVDLAPTIALHDVTNTTQTIGKRKRTPEPNTSQKEQINGDSITIDPQPSESFHDLLQDIIEVLQEYDISPPILQRPISTIVNNHDVKRTKLSDANATTTVSSQVRSRIYKEIDSFYKDVKVAIASLSAEEVEQTKNKVTEFETELRQIIQHEISHSSFPIPRALDDEKDMFIDKGELGALSRDPELVLTALGIAHGSVFPAKKLYSSLRLGGPWVNKAKTILPSLDLERLPHGITAASIRTEKGSAKADAKTPTLAELFRSSRPRQMEVPRPSSHVAARGQTISWSQPELQTRPHRSSSRVSFYNQSLSSGQWLSYNVSPSSSQLPSTGEKRKQRDRALSTGEANAELTEEDQEEIRLVKEARQKAREDALFKSTYSSFAPTHDNTAAVVPQQVKSRLWWDKYGSHKPLRYFEDYEEEEEEDGIDDDVSEELESKVYDDDAKFEEMVDSWEDIDTTPAVFKVKDGDETATDKTDKDVDELMKDVSEMLETLSSYQRNRNISANPKQQGSTTQSKSLVELAGDPSHPSNAESLLYETLKSQLTLIISSLPPYAVTKLDGEKLGELNISTKMVVQVPIHKGTLSDQESRKANQAPVPNATPIARPQSGLSSRTPSYQQPASAPANRPPSTLGKTPSHASYLNSGYRQPSSTGNYNSSQSTPRVSYSQYGQQPPATSASQLANGTRHLANGYSAYSNQPSTPTANSANALRTSGTQLQRPSQPGYQQRAQNSAQQQTYSNYNINMHNRNSSPPNPAMNNVTPAARAVASYATPGQTPGRPGWFPSNGTIGSMFSAEEVQTLENRQKMQMAAQHAQIRQNSDTPQPTRPTSVHSNGAQSNGTPIPTPQPNGEVVGI